MKENWNKEGKLSHHIRNKNLLPGHCWEGFVLKCPLKSNYLSVKRKRVRSSKLSLSLSLSLSQQLRNLQWFFSFWFTVFLCLFYLFYLFRLLFVNQTRLMCFLSLTFHFPPPPLLPLFVFFSLPERQFFVAFVLNTHVKRWVSLSLSSLPLSFLLQDPTVKRGAKKDKVRA